MAGKDKRYKYLEDVIEDYLYLMDEKIELPLSCKKTKAKLADLKEELHDNILDKEQGEDFFKLYTQEKKSDERKKELEEELAEVERILKEFLHYVDGHQVSYEKKDDVEKIKHTYLFWLENGEIKSNRELTKNTKRSREFA